MDASEAKIERLVRMLGGPDTDEAKDAISEIELTSRTLLDVESSSARVWFERLVEVVSSTGGLVAGSRVEVLLIFVQWFVKEGEWQTAVGAGERAVELARLLNAESSLRRSLNVLGMAYSQSRNLADAFLCYAEGIEIAEKLGDRVGTCATIANLADAQFNAGLLEESITLNKYVVDLASDEPHLMSIKMGAHHNLAIAYLALEDVESAKHHIELALTYVSEPRHQFWAMQRVFFESTFAKIMLRLGDSKAARNHQQLALRYSKQTGGRPARVQATLIEAMCDAADGKIDDALASLDRVKQDIQPYEVSLRDFYEAELACNQYGGRDGYAKFYQGRYLSDLALWQRRAAIQQVAALQRSIRVRGNVRECIESLAVLAELKEDSTGQHSFRVGRMAALVACRLGYDDKRAQALEFASRLHDIGKLAVPDAVVLKRGQLSPAEMEIMRRHTIEGSQILADLLSSVEQVPFASRGADTDVLRLASEIALYHHEWWDGSGYPMGLAKESIPEASRIVAIADAFDEMIHVRPYKQAVSVQASLDELSRLSGIQFEPRIVASFIEVVEDLRSEFGPQLRSFVNSAVKSSPLLNANRTVDRIVRQARIPSAANFDPNHRVPAI